MICLAMNYYKEEKKTPYILPFHFWYSSILLFRAHVLKEINIDSKYPRSSNPFEFIITYENQVHSIKSY